MKRLILVLMVLCLMFGVCSVAAAAVSIVEQPETMTVKKGGNVTFTVKAKNAGGSSITWYFTNPVTGEVVTGKKLSTAVSGLKVSNPNSLKITLKKVPESMHGWTLYCHIGPKSGGVNTDTVMLLIEGMEVPDTLATLNAAPADEAVTDASSASMKNVSAAGTAVESAAVASETPAVPTATPVPEKIVITGSTKIELYNVDSKGEPVGTAQQELTFEEPTASFYVKLPDTTEGTIQYVTVDSVRLTPDGEVRGMSIRGWPASASVKIKVLKPGAEEEQTIESLLPPLESEAPVDPSTLVTVTCENCRFTGYHSSFATSGQVPAGTTITVVASGGMVAKGYTINGAKKATHKNEATFQLVVEEDTTITMQKQK